ncbi:MAG: hypothetical protein HZA91_07590 [Verrucomicrobia bacterium]|nr:hypothetical protein [Verrucomicrobiota bacterium]
MSKPNDVPSSAPTPRRRKWPLVLGGFVAILAGIVLLLPVITNTFVRPQVIAVLRGTFTGEPAIDRLSYSLFSGVEIEGFRIANPPGFSPGNCIVVERLTVDPMLLALFKGAFIFPKGLRATKPQVLVEQDAKGRINLACLLKGGGGETPLALGSLFTDDLNVSVKTPALDRPVALAPIRIEVRAEDLDRPITFAVKNSDASLDVKGNALIAFGGKIKLKKTQAELDYAITPALLAPLKPVLASFGPVKKFEGTLAGAGRVTLDGLARPAGKGQLTLDVPELAMLVATGGTNVVQTLRPGLTQLSYEFKPHGDRQTDLDLNLTSPAASVAFKGVATNDPKAPALEADITMTADIAALAERFPGYLTTGRKLQGRIAGSVKGLKATAKSFAADLDFRGEGLAEIGPSGAPVPLVKDLASKLRFNLDLEKKIYRIENLDAHVDDALQTKGRFTFEQRATGSAFEADLTLGADLDALMAKARRFTDMIPPTLPLAGRVDAHVVVPPESGQAATPLNIHVEVNNLKTTGIVMPYGEADITGAGSASWTKVEIKSLSAFARVAPGGAAATQAPLEVKLSGRGTADLAVGRYDVPELRVTLPGAEAAVAASAVIPTKAGEPLSAASVAAAVNAAGSIKPLLDLARVWGVKLEGMDGSGIVNAQLQSSGTLSQLVVKKLHAEVKNLVLTGTNAPTAIGWPQSLAADAALTLNALDPLKSPIEIASGSAQLAGIAVTSLKGKLALDPASDQTDLQITGTLDPVALAAAAPGYFKDVTVASGAGPFDIRLRGALLGAKQDITAKLDLPETTLKPAKLAGDPIKLGKPSLDVQASLDASNKTYRVSRASLKTALANLDGQGNIALDAQGKIATLDGKLDGAADLTALGAVAVAMGALTNTTELTGNLKLAADVKAGGGAFPYTATLTGQSIHFKGPQTKGIAIDEPEPVVKLTGTFANTKGGFAVTIADGSELRSQIARGTVTGTVRSQANQPASAENLVADLTYDAARLKPLLTALSAGEIRATGPQPARIAFTGPLSPGTNTLAWLGGISLAAKLGYGSYTNTGVVIEGPPIALELKGGRLPVDYACKINGGATSLKGDVDVNQRTHLTLAAKDVGLSVGLLRFLKFLNSFINVEKSTVDGTASLDADMTYDGPLPLPMPANLTGLLAAKLTGKGNYSAQNLRITGSPMLNELMNFVGEGKPNDPGGIQPTHFVIERGEFRTEKAVMKLSGVELTLAGSVRFDQTLDLQLGLPTPKRIRDANATVAEFLPATLVIPVKGKIGETKIDYGQAVTAALKDAGGNALKGKAGDLLKGLFGTKKK